MKHIITVHYKTNDWIDLQLKQINKHVSNYKIWTYCDGIDIKSHQFKFHYCENSEIDGSKIGYLDHMLKLNSLTDVVLSDVDTQDNDLLIWLDSDAFPIKNMDCYVAEKLLRYPLIAVNRPENGGDVIPHPSFTCTTVSFWKEHRLNWNGVPGDNVPTNKHGLHDPGGKMYIDLKEKNIEWYKLLRTRSLTRHEVFYTIYDDLIYHHGAGSRFPECRGGNFDTTIDTDKMFRLISAKISSDDFN